MMTKGKDDAGDYAIKARIIAVDEQNVTFESEGRTIVVPITDVGKDLQMFVQLIRQHKGQLEALQDLEISVMRCTEMWVMDNCWAAYCCLPKSRYLSMTEDEALKRQKGT